MALHDNVIAAADAAKNVKRLERIIESASTYPFCYWSDSHRMLMLKYDGHSTTAMNLKASKEILITTANEIHESFLTAYKCELEEAKIQFTQLFASGG